MRKTFYKFFIILILLFSLTGCNLLINDPVTENINLEEELDKVYSLVNDVSNIAMKGNVKIVTTSYASSFPFPEVVSGQGSGVIFSEDKNNYFILTNNHVVNRDDTYNLVRYQITDYLGNEYNGSLIASSPAYDLGLLKITKSDVQLNVLSINLTTLIKDDLVIAIGQPKGQDNTITMGKVLGFTNGNLEQSTSHVDFDVILHNAPINRGSSGGVLINSNLEIVGINYAGSFKEGVEGSVSAYAIPMIKVNEFLVLNNFY
ncbi:MAG: trypsin-like peptidase domain-containing protein [Bacilli bacterium]|jgi:serine protease Do|nr:trypsin-like peptidase domain-containing protein [Bacilli bacterium]MDD3121660.1 trypsin-like peptidase domain-containing protein [Bacilli bacterium]MDD4063737.1 trypsin-like peptidase domain-containing protein [Bacilli bacterium]MDD4482438.1 trypsin-like peptidase domain-containing protein [Bacilli bacterium]MDY0364127.1 trypsin-like peptidase domain-containing protein [Bacilli bacterium]